MYNTSIYRRDHSLPDQAVAINNVSAAEHRSMEFGCRRLMQRQMVCSPGGESIYIYLPTPKVDRYRCLVIKRNINR